MSQANDTLSTPRLLMQGIGKRFGETVALSEVDLSVASGEILALVGENGAGKSTLMKILSGATHPDSGHMSLDGKPYRPASPLAGRRLGVAMIYQELCLAPHLSVMENIALGVEPSICGFVNWPRMRRLATDALAQLSRPDIRPDTPVRNLSIASRQLVEIARAIAMGSRVLVLDEPTSSLTRPDAEHLFTLLRRLKSRGLAIIYISHFLEEVRDISDRFAVLRDGKTAGSGPSQTTSMNHIVSLMVGRSLDQLYPRSTRIPGDPVLEIKRLSGQSKPLDVSLELHRGEVVGIAGLVGAGRTELLRTIFGLDPIKSGRVKLGTYVAPASPSIRWAQKIGLVSEDRKTEGLALTLSIADNVTLTRLSFLVRPKLHENRARQWIDKLLIRCRSPHQKVHELSGGNQQKIAVARLLNHNVDIFLLDEPTRGIDIAAKAQIYQLIHPLPCAGKTVLMVSSYLPELLGVCDRIAVMCKGHLGPALPAYETNQHKIMMESTGATEAA